mmetsp:Transcript_32159/g.31910  ORF Transcript_32159/g.31910 Transcript_32159/m.31910 type:complete len:140 (-) Transcript_32159:297-716(-)
MCFLTDPGSVPELFNLDTLNNQELIEECVESDIVSAKSSFCNKCQKARPARAHHCSVCDKCILRMDHHCPWIGNCVGFYNHRYFIQFLLYAGIGLFIVSTSCASLLWEHYGDGHISTLFGGIVGFSLALSVFGMGIFHL